MSRDIHKWVRGLLRHRVSPKVDFTAGDMLTTQHRGQKQLPHTDARHNWFLSLPEVPLLWP